MNKSELVVAMAEKSGLSKADAERALDAFTGAVGEVLQGGGDIRLSGFGTFAVADQAERQGRNPRTGESMTFPATKKVKFKAGKSLNDLVAG